MKATELVEDCRTTNEIFPKRDTIPVYIRKPAPVPLQWRKEVQDDIIVDVGKGILEKFPHGTPDMWCTRMVIQAKKNGKLRRTIYLSALSKVSIRDSALDTMDNPSGRPGR